MTLYWVSEGERKGEGERGRWEGEEKGEVRGREGGKERETCFEGVCIVK